MTPYTIRTPKKKKKPNKNFADQIDPSVPIKLKSCHVFARLALREMTRVAQSHKEIS